MSLTSTFVQFTDGKFYRDPVIKGPNYFLCFDDDDPPELVVKRHPGEDKDEFINRCLGILRDLRIQFKVLRVEMRGGQRSFNGKFETASNMFLHILAPLPIEILPQGLLPAEKNTFMGSVYEWPKDKVTVRADNEQVRA